MRKLPFIALAAALVVGAGAQAQTSEYFHVPAAGVNDLTVHGGYGLGTVRGTGAGAEDLDYNGLRNLGVTWAYSYSDMWSFGADVAYTSIDAPNGAGADAKSSGIEPIRLFAAGKNMLGGGTLSYGVRAQFAVEKAKLEANGDTNRTFGDILSNYGEGGFELAPWVGWSMQAGPGVFGARFSYEVLNTDTKVDNAGAPEATLSGGSEGQAAVFYEYMLADMPLGAALTYDFYSAIDSETNGVESEFAASRSLIGVSLYTRLGAENFSFIPQLIWREKASGSDVDKLSDVRLNVAGRFSF